MIDLQELRRLAEAVKNITVSKDFDGYHTALYRFEAAFSEITAIELIDRLEAAEKVCMAVTVRLKQHSQNCDYVTPRMIHEPCTCGTWKLINALAAWQKVKEASNDV